jgi:hypothetical protein
MIYPGGKPVNNQRILMFVCVVISIVAITTGAIAQNAAVVNEWWVASFTDQGVWAIQAGPFTTLPACQPLADHRNLQYHISPRSVHAYWCVKEVDGARTVAIYVLQPANVGPGYAAYAVSSAFRYSVGNFVQDSMTDVRQQAGKFWLAWYGTHNIWYMQTGPFAVLSSCTDLLNNLTKNGAIPTKYACVRQEPANQYIVIEDPNGDFSVARLM